MKIKDHKTYRAIYQLELAEEITGKTRKTLSQRMKRNHWTLANTIKAYLKQTYHVA